MSVDGAGRGHAAVLSQLEERGGSEWVGSARMVEDGDDGRRCVGVLVRDAGGRGEAQPRGLAGVIREAGGNAGALRGGGVARVLGFGPAELVAAGFDAVAAAPVTGGTDLWFADADAGDACKRRRWGATARQVAS